MQLNERQKKEVERVVAMSEIFKRFFDGPDGDYVLAILKKQIGGFDPDPYVNAYNCGMRDFYGFITSLVEADNRKAMELLNAENQTGRKKE